MNPIEVLLVEDHPIVRRGIANMLSGIADINLVGEAGTGQEAVQMVKDLQPDVVLLDMELPDIPGTEVARQLHDQGCKAKVLALSAYDDPGFIRVLLDSGAEGYLIKDEALDIICESIRGVARGEKGWFSRRVNAQLTDLLRDSETSKVKLTARQIEVINGIVKGKTNKMIAAELKISEKTVEKYIESLFAKLGATSRVEVAVIAVRDEATYKITG